MTSCKTTVENTQSFAHFERWNHHWPHDFHHDVTARCEQICPGTPFTDVNEVKFQHIVNSNKFSNVWDEITHPRRCWNWSILVEGASGVYSRANTVPLHKPNMPFPLRWRHKGRDSVSNHQPHDWFYNRLFRRRSKKTSKLYVTGLCVGNSPGTGEFPAQMARYAENISIWWRHHVWKLCNLLFFIVRSFWTWCSIHHSKDEYCFAIELTTDTGLSALRSALLIV